MSKRVKRDRCTYSIKMRCGPCDSDIYVCTIEQAGQMLNESDIRVGTPLGATARFVHRPWTVKHLVSGIDRSMSNELLMCCLIRDHDQRHTFAWLTEGEYNSRRAGCPSSEAVVQPIMTARAWVDRGWQRRAIGDLFIDYEAENSVSDAYEETIVEKQYQDVLLLYEDELLRRNVVDIRRPIPGFVSMTKCQLNTRSESPASGGDGGGAGYDLRMQRSSRIIHTLQCGGNVKSAKHARMILSTRTWSYRHPRGLDVRRL